MQILQDFIATSYFLFQLFLGYTNATYSEDPHHSFKFMFRRKSHTRNVLGIFEDVEDDTKMYFRQKFSVPLLPSFQSNQKHVGTYMNLVLQNIFLACHKKWGNNNKSKKKKNGKTERLKDWKTHRYESGSIWSKQTDWFIELA